MYSPPPLQVLLRPSPVHFEEDMNAMASRGLRGVWASSYHGFDLALMDRLPEWRFDALHAQDGGPTCVEPIRRMPWLRNLSVGTGVGGPVPLDLSRHLDLDSLSLEWHPKLRLPAELPRLRYLALWKYKPRAQDLTELPALPAIEHLRLVQGNVRCLDGIERFPTLRRVEVAYNRSLVDVSALGTLRDLEELCLDRCPNVADLAPLAGCTALQAAVVDGVRELPTLQWVRSLPLLRHLSVRRCNVLDGDLSVGDRLESFHHDRRPHYNRKPPVVRITLRPAP